jgi:lysophospholipase L1-like esterase
MRLIFACSLGATLVAAGVSAADHPTLFLAGDSTVRNNTRGQMGWGQVVAEQFDTNRLTVANHALGGRSSRTFLTEGLWDKLLAEARAGDFVLIQFGHNDGGPMDEGRARASIKGTSDESRVVTNKTTGKVETVRTYGGYLRHYVTTARAKGVEPILVSLVPRNIWKDGKVIRSTADYGGWAAQVARELETDFLDLNSLVADRYDTLGKEAVDKLFGGDHTHPNEEGARLNAACVAEGIRALPRSKLKQYLKPPK